MYNITFEEYFNKFIIFIKKIQWDYYEINEYFISNKYDNYNNNYQ